MSDLELHKLKFSQVLSDITRNSDEDDQEEELQCECCEDPRGTVWKINGILVCEKCNNFECGVCFREAEDYDVEWCENLQMCVCPECFK